MNKIKCSQNPTDQLQLSLKLHQNNLYYFLYLSESFFSKFRHHAVSVTNILFAKRLFTPLQHKYLSFCRS